MLVYVFGVCIHNIPWCSQFLFRGLLLVPIQYFCLIGPHFHRAPPSSAVCLSVSSLFLIWSHFHLSCNSCNFPFTFLQLREVFFFLFFDVVQPLLYFPKPLHLLLAKTNIQDAHTMYTIQEKICSK